jgi:hypothetical protein
MREPIGSAVIDCSLFATVEGRLRLVGHSQGAARNDLVDDFHGRRTANLLSARPHRCLAELRGLGRGAHALVFLKMLSRRGCYGELRGTGEEVCGGIGLARIDRE